jgi:glyoxylase-like metal-dependent hydrolase (beta-lactamase superfamily II)
MKEILPGIFQINLTLSGFPPGSVNMYLFRAEDGYLSIDTGWDSAPSVQSLQEQLSEIGACISDIKQVIITHCHIDHLGMVPRFKNTNNPKLYIHEKELELIKVRFSGGDNFLPLTDSFLKTHGFPESELLPPEIQLPVAEGLSLIEPDVLLKGGEIIPAGQYNLKVINTPGHTPGHIVLYEPDKKFVISGDMLLPTIATNAAIHVQHIFNPLDKYLNSIRALQKMDIQQVLPGHEYVFSNPVERIDEVIHHNRKKSNEIYKVFAEGQPRTAYDISKYLARSSKNGTTNWNKLTNWDKRFAVLQSIAYLEEMTFANKLTRFSKDGSIYYGNLNK